MMTNTSEIRSTEDVREASPIFNARNESREEMQVTTPAATRYIQVLRSMRVTSGSTPCQATTLHDTSRISTDFTAKARLEPRF